MASPTSKAICVLGMHRSGTSATASAIQLLGAYLGEQEELQPPTRDNVEGSRERKDICVLHEKILQTLDTAWDTSFPLPQNWHLSPEIALFREELVDLIKTNFAHHRLWAWKDPRTAILLPLWRDVLRELKISFSCLLVTRNPLDVARSLEQRDGFPTHEALGIWLNYNVAMVQNTSGLPRALITYDRFLEDWEATLRPCARTLSLSSTRASRSTREAINRALRTDLRHSTSKLEDLESAGCPAPVRELALILEGVARTGNFEQASVESKMRRLLETHSSLSGLYRHDVSRHIHKTRELVSEAARLENVRESQLREVNRLLEVAEARSGDVQRLAAENVALKEEVVQSLRSLVQEKDLQLAEQRQQLAAGERVLAEERQRSTKQAEEIVRRRASLEERQRDLAGFQTDANQLREVLQEKDLQLAEQRQQLAAGERVLAEERQRSTKQAEEIVRRRASLEERERDLAGFQTDANQLREVLTERDAQLGHARSELQVLANSFYASYSWRITHPLRVAYDALRPLQRVLRRALRSALTLARFKVAQKTQPTFGPSDRRGSSADGVGARQEGEPSERA